MNNKYFRKIFIAILFVVTSLKILAFDTSHNDVLLAPQCFLDNNSITYNELAYNKKQAMVLLNVNRQHLWQKLTTINYNNNCGKFFNVTDDWQEYLENKSLTNGRLSTLDYEYFLEGLLLNNSPDNTKFKKEVTAHQFIDLNQTKEKQELVDKLYASLDKNRINKSLEEFSEHYNRAAYTKDGYEAATHLNNWMKELSIKHKDNNSSLTVEYIATNSYYKQPSVVAAIGKDLPGDALVISAHMDTNGGGRRPGADDDGSGSMVVLETARLLMESNQTFNRPIYFMWYAAEEMGLVGSKIISKEFIKRGTKIDSVLHFDTIGRRADSNDPTLFLLRDNVDQSFTDYMSELIKTYVKVPVDYTTCGYACSDHASWTNAGFTATAAFEAKFDDINPYIHTTNDKIEHVSLDNLVNYTKLALAYVADKSTGN